MSFLFAFLSPVPASTSSIQAKAPPSELTPACSSSCPDCNATTGIASGLSSLPLVSAADCPPPCGHRSLCRKAGASHRRQVHRSNQSPSRLSLREQAEKPGNQKGTRCPADALFCFLGVLLTCGFIPGSGGFPECSAQHRTVRRRAAVKSAAEEAAHRRSKWRCPDQAGMPSVRWQWLCGAGH